MHNFTTMSQTHIQSTHSHSLKTFGRDSRPEAKMNTNKNRVKFDLLFMVLPFDSNKSEHQRLSSIVQQ